MFSIVVGSCACCIHILVQISPNPNFTPFWRTYSLTVLLRRGRRMTTQTIMAGNWLVPIIVIPWNTSRLSSTTLDAYTFPILCCWRRNGRKMTSIPSWEVYGIRYTWVCTFYDYVERQHWKVDQLTLFSVLSVNHYIYNLFNVVDW